MKRYRGGWDWAESDVVGRSSWAVAGDGGRLGVVPLWSARTRIRAVVATTHDAHNVIRVPVWVHRI